MKVQLFILLASTMLFCQEEAFETINNKLSDKEAYEAQNYVHQGKAQDTLYTECSKKGAHNCDEALSSAEVSTVWGIDENVARAISGLYTSFFGAKSLAGGKLPTSKFVLKEGKSAEGVKDIKVGKDSKPGKDLEDWCSVIPIGTELVGNAMMQSSVNLNSPSLEGAYAQTESLYQLKSIHKQRSKAAKVQTAGFAASSACYTGYILLNMANFRPTFGLYAKLAASTVLAAFYREKVVRHQSYAKYVQGVIDKMPGKGDCNPHTQTHCFCSEETSYSYDASNYLKYCITEEMKTRTNPQTAMICVDSNLKADPNCTCKTNNSCLDEQIAIQTRTLGLDPNIVNNLGNTSTLFDGVYNGGAIDNQAKSWSAIAQKGLKDPEDIPTVDLSPEQKEDALTLSKMGLPPKLSAFGASLPHSASAIAKLSSGGGAPQLSSGDIKKKTNEASNITTLTFAPGTAQRKQNSPSGSGASNPFANFGLQKKKEEKTGNIDVVEFSQMAQEEAEINKDNEASLFETISRRYKVSGSKKLK